MQYQMVFLNFTRHCMSFILLPLTFIKLRIESALKTALSFKKTYCKMAALLAKPSMRLCCYQKKN